MTGGTQASQFILLAYISFFDGILRSAGSSLPPDGRSRLLHFGVAGTAMGSWGIGYARPLCQAEDCGRRAYTMDEVLGPTCCVCFAAAQRAWAARFWGGPPGRQRFPLQLHLIGERGDLTLSFVFGDGWSGQCSCTRCDRRWLNNGWTCPVDHNRSRYLRMLDEFYAAYSYSPDELPR